MSELTKTTKAVNKIKSNIATIERLIELQDIKTSYKVKIEASKKRMAELKAKLKK